jgi:hypothetical protein
MNKLFDTRIFDQADLDKSFEIHDDCLVGLGSKHIDFEDDIHSSRDKITQILARNHLMIKNDTETAKALLDLLYPIYVDSVQKAAQYEIIWSK